MAYDSVVEFSRPEYAERAIRKLDRVDFMGRPVFVREDRGSRRERPERNNQKDAQEATPEQRLHVGNVSSDSDRIPSMPTHHFLSFFFFLLLGYISYLFPLAGRT